MNDHLIIGKIIGAHGIRGEVKVFPITDNVRRFTKLKKCFIVKEDGTVIKEFEVRGARIDKTNALVAFKDLFDRTEAEKLKGTYISVDRDNAVKLQKGSFFIADLIGSKVIDDTIGELGIITDVFETGANQVLEVKRPGKQNLLIPFLKAVCYEIDPEQGVVKVKLPDGLYELYED